jgi:hypothetical protein
MAHPRCCCVSSQVPGLGFAVVATASSSSLLDANGFAAFAEATPTVTASVYPADSPADFPADHPTDAHAPPSAAPPTAAPPTAAAAASAATASPRTPPGATAHASATLPGPSISWDRKMLFMRQSIGAPARMSASRSSGSDAAGQ